MAEPRQRVGRELSFFPLLPRPPQLKGRGDAEQNVKRLADWATLNLLPSLERELRYLRRLTATQMVEPDTATADSSKVLLAQGAGEVAAWLPQSSIDHGSLGGLADDDHLQYLPRDGSRPMTGVDGIDYTPGSDVDVDIATINVTGTPKFWWDEAADSFEMSKPLTVVGIADGALGSYDLKVGDVVTPDYGIIRFGDGLIGRTSYNVGSLDLDGTVIFRNMGTPATSNIEFVFTESGGGAIRFALAKSGAGNASYCARSMLIAGPAVNDDELVTVGYWRTNNSIFDNIACDTEGDGADLGVQNDLEVEGDIFTDSIKESTTGAGITVADLLDVTGGAQSYSGRDMLRYALMAI